MIYRLIFILIISTSSLSAQYFFWPGDTLFVWAHSGLNLRESADSKSDIISTIPFGKRVLLDANVQSDEKLIKIIDSKVIKGKRTPSYSLKGRMIKVIYNDTAGFVYSGFLSRIDPILKQFDYNYDKILTQKYGEIKSFILSDTIIGAKEIVFGNGVLHLSVGGSNWFKETYVFPYKTFQEGILLILLTINSDELDRYSDNWFIYKKEENLIEFHETNNMYRILLKEVDDLLIITYSGSN